MDLLVVAPCDPELAALRAKPGSAMRGRVGAWEIGGAAVGIGLVDAAVGASSTIAALGPRAVVMVGTCGAYRSEPAVGAVVAMRRAILVEPAAIEGRAAIPEIVAVAC